MEVEIDKIIFTQYKEIVSYIVYFLTSINDIGNSVVIENKYADEIAAEYILQTGLKHARAPHRKDSILMVMLGKKQFDNLSETQKLLYYPVIMIQIGIIPLNPKQQLEKNNKPFDTFFEKLIKKKCEVRILYKAAKGNSDNNREMAIALLLPSSSR